MVILRIAHVLVAAAWFGHKLLIPGDLREVARDPDLADERFVARVERAQMLGVSTGVATLASGLGLYMWVGPSAVSSSIHLGLAIAIGMFVVGAVAARPGWARVREGMATGDAAAIRSGATRVSNALIVESGLWVGVLVTMLV